jgi:hypothetical protein
MTPTDATTPALDPPEATPPDPLAEPTAEECLLEWSRYRDDEKAGRLSFEGVPGGHRVACFDGRTLDYDADYMALSARLRTRAFTGRGW